MTQPECMQLGTTQLNWRAHHSPADWVDADAKRYGHISWTQQGTSPKQHNTLPYQTALPTPVTVDAQRLVIPLGHVRSASSSGTPALSRPLGRKPYYQYDTTMNPADNCNDDRRALQAESGCKEHIPQCTANRPRRPPRGGGGEEGTEHQAGARVLPGVAAQSPPLQCITLQSATCRDIQCPSSSSTAHVHNIPSHMPAAPCLQPAPLPLKALAQYQQGHTLADALCLWAASQAVYPGYLSTNFASDRLTTELYSGTFSCRCFSARNCSRSSLLSLVVSSCTRDEGLSCCSSPVQRGCVPAVANKQTQAIINTWAKQWHRS